MTSHRNALRQYRQLLACVFLVLATGAISTSLLRGASLSPAEMHPQPVLRGASLSTGGTHPRRPGRFSGAGTDSQVVYSVQRFTHTSSSSLWDDDGDNFNADTVNGRRYIVQLNSSTGMSQLRLSVNGQEFVGSSEGTILQREIDVTSGTNSFDILTKGSTGSWVDVRIVRVSDPTFIVYGPKTFTQPNPAAKQVDTFSIVHPSKSPYTLRVINGSGSGSNRVTNATLSVNGVAVMGSSDLGTGRATKTYNVSLDTASVNRDTLYNQTATGTYLSLRFTATDSTAPAVTISTPAPGFATRGGVRIKGSVVDETYGLLFIDTLTTFSRAAIAISPPTTSYTDSLTLPGVDGKYRIRFHAINSAWLTTDTSVTVVRDTRAPTLTVDSLTVGVQYTTTASNIHVSGSWTDSTLTSITVDGDTVATGTSGTFSYVFALDYGQNMILYRAVDAVGNVNEARRYVVRGVDNSTAPDSALSALNPMQTGIVPFFRSVDFLYAGETSFDSTKIDTNIAAVVRGLVVGRDYTGIGNVAVSVLGHDEFGQTLTRKDGRFDLIVNGGARLTLRFTKTNFLETQRQIAPLWNDYATLDTVAMVGATSRVTGVSLGADTVVAGRFATDANGDRRLRMLFRQGTTVSVVRAPGDTVTLPPGVHVRATEYTIGSNGPKAMPGLLPSGSAYTYCVDLRLDEADAQVGAGLSSPETRFSKRIPCYVPNFLHLPVGVSIPMGYYDPRGGVWKADSDGVVIKILSKSANGDTARIDSRGIGSADSQGRLDSLHVDTGELRQLAAQFTVGDSLVRTTTDHFTTLDYNLNVAASTAATSTASGRAQQMSGLVGQSCTATGSIIECENRVLGESVPIIGTPYTLNYRSYRFSGDKAIRTLRIPVTGTTVPAGLQSVIVRMEVAGKRQDTTLTSPGSNAVATLVWDGTDTYGRQVDGSVNARVSVGYRFAEVYAAGAGGRSLGDGAANGASYDVVNGDRGVSSVRWTRRIVSLGAPSTSTDGLGGWTISPHHFYDLTGQGALYRGDGSVVLGSLRHPIISVGIASGSGNVVLGTDRSFYVARDFHITKYSYTGGSSVEVAGTGTSYGTVFHDNVSATAYGIESPVRIAVGPDNSVYFVMHAPPGNSGGPAGHVCKVTPDGIIHSIAGTDNVTSVGTGDGGPATSATFSSTLTAIAVGPDGSVYVGDHDARKVRRIAPNGIITTYAGSGSTNTTGTDSSGVATKIGLGDVTDLATDPDGNLYVATGGNGSSTTKIVRRVRPDGTISTFAKFDGAPGSSLDGVTMGPDGVLYAAMSGAASGGAIHGGIVWRRDPDSTVTALGGGGTYTPDGVFATAADLGLLASITASPDGAVYFGAGNILRIGSSVPSVAANEFVVPSDDGSEVYFFDLRGRHLRTRDALTGGVRYSFDYDSYGRLIGIHDPAGNVTTIVRSSGVPTEIHAPFGQVTKLTLQSGFLKSVANPKGEVVSLAPRTDGLLDSLTDSRNHKFTYTWDSDEGRLHVDSDPESGSQTLVTTYDKNARTVTRTTGENRQTTYVVTDLYDGTQQRRITTPDGARIALSDSTDARLHTLLPDGLSSTDSLAPDPRSFGMLAPVIGRVTNKLPSGLTRYVDITTSVSPSNFNPQTTNGTWSRDVKTNLRTPDHMEFKSDSLMLITQSPLGRVTRTAVDSVGRLLKLTVKGLDDIEFAYDSHGRLIYLRQGKRGWSHAYDGSGRDSSIRDTLGRVTGFGYDNADRVTSEVLPDTQAVSFGYDANGNLTSATPPGRSAHTFDHTGVDLVSQYTPPDIGIGYRATTYSFNKDRQLSQVLRPDSVVVGLSYVSGTDQLRAVSIPRGSVTYKYLASGAVDSIVSPDGEKLIFAYDGPLQLAETYRGPVIGRVERTYDPDFRPSVEMVDSSASITQRYDLDGLLVGSGVDSIVYRTNDALPDSTSLAGFIATSTQDYDGAGNLANLHYGWNGGSLLQSYARDGLGRITTLYEAIGTDTARTYGYIYTTAGRLREVDRGGNVLARYDYDANGNRIAVTGPGGATDSATATYDGQDRMLRNGGTAYSYTKNGELKSKISGTDTTTYTYDELGNLVTVVLPRPNMDRIDYLIDGLNRRVGRKVNGHQLTGWLYRDALSPIAQLDSVGAVTARYVYGSRSNVPDYVVKSGTIYRLITDHLGSVRLVVNASTGAVMQRLDYDAWGKVLTDTSPGYQLFGFDGGLYDSDVGLERFGARDYDPTIGRWTSKDPRLRSWSEGNQYAFATLDPVNLSDASGTTGMSEECRNLLETILNIEKTINRRYADLREDRQNLKWSCPGDDLKPGLSRRGHIFLINKDKARLAVLKALYLARCGGTPPGGLPKPGQNFFDPQLWDKVAIGAGVTSAAAAIIDVLQDPEAWGWLVP